MASMAYPILVFIFIFGAVAGYINETGLYCNPNNIDCYTIPHGSSVMTEGSVQELTTQAQAVNPSPLSYLDWIFLFIKVIAAGVTAIFTLGPLLKSFGIPVGMEGMFVSPLALIVAFWLVEIFWKDVTS